MCRALREYPVGPLRFIQIGVILSYKPVRKTQWTKVYKVYKYAMVKPSSCKDPKGGGKCKISCSICCNARPAGER